MSSDKETKIIVSMILEIVGRPPEHLTETLNKIIGEIDNEKDVVVTNKKINEPVIMKDQKDFYTSFAEIEVEVQDIQKISVLTLKYMPAHIEIIEPEVIALTNNLWNETFNEVLRRLHQYDEVARMLQAEKQILTNKLKSLMPEKKE